MLVEVVEAVAAVGVSAEPRTAVHQTRRGSHRTSHKMMFVLPRGCRCHRSEPTQHKLDGTDFDLRFERSMAGKVVMVVPLADLEVKADLTEDLMVALVALVELEENLAEEAVATEVVEGVETVAKGSGVGSVGSC